MSNIVRFRVTSAGPGRATAAISRIFTKATISDFTQRNTYLFEFLQSELPSPRTTTAGTVRIRNERVNVLPRKAHKLILIKNNPPVGYETSRATVDSCDVSAAPARAATPLECYNPELSTGWLF